MLNKNAKKWVKALKSGKYTQTTDSLMDSTGFCCLGVACDLYSKEHPRSTWENGHFMGQAFTLPMVVQRWLGLSTEDGSTTDASLVDYNDGNTSGDIRRHSFKEIAKIIESEPEGLFGKVTSHAG